AEPPVFALAQPPLRRAVGGGRLAARPFAGRALGAQPTILVGLDPDAVEQGGVAFHDLSVCAPPAAIFKACQVRLRPFPTPSALPDIDPPARLPICARPWQRAI